LNVCNISISNLRNENVILHAKIDELNACKPSTSAIEHVVICTKCRDINVDAINDHLALIKQQNDHIAQLTAKINEHKIENEKFKFARSMLYSGRRPGIKDSIGFQQGSNVKLNAPKDCLILLRARLPWLRIMRVTFYILLVIPSTRLGEFMLESLILFPVMLLCTRMRHLALGIIPMLKCLKKKTPTASNEPNVSFKTFDVSYVLTNKSGKIVAKYVGGKHKGSKTCVLGTQGACF
jgi:hypothetical protein